MMPMRTSADLRGASRRARGFAARLRLLIRERGTDGSPVNQYAPFYLWDAVDGMGRFLWVRVPLAADGVHCTALAVDPQRWEIVHFTLWRDSSPPAVGTRYQVLQLSTGSAR